MATISLVTDDPAILPRVFDYQIAALDLIDQGQADSLFHQAIRASLAFASRYLTRDNLHNSLTFETAHATYSVPFHEILFFETTPTIHKLCLHTLTDTFEFYGQLNKIAASDQRLFKCHKSYVVNPENVLHLDKENGLAHFNNKETCYVSKAKYKQLGDLMKSQG